MKHLKRLKLAVFGIVILFFASIAYPFFMEAMGFYTLEPGWQVGEMLAKEGGSAKKCNKIIRGFWWDVLSPPTSEQRKSCIKEYAKLTKDPKACELLLPSDYGWSCLGAAREKQPCLFDFKDPPEVRGNGLIAPLSQCNNGDSATRNNECCAVARIAFFDEKTNCASIGASQNFIDQCYYELAKKKADTSLCSSIESGNIRTACEVAVRALLSKSKSS